MSIAHEIEKCHKNRIESIKKMQNGIDKNMAIGSLVADLGKNSINAVSHSINCSWRKVKACSDLFLKIPLKLISEQVY